MRIAGVLRPLSTVVRASKELPYQTCASHTCCRLFGLLLEPQSLLHWLQGCVGVVMMVLYRHAPCLVFSWWCSSSYEAIRCCMLLAI